MVYAPNHAASNRQSETIDFDSILVFMEWRDIYSSVVHLTTDEKGGMLGPDQPSSKMSCTIY